MRGKNIILFLIGSIVYYGLEVLYRTFSYWQCALLGGLAFLIIGLINEKLSWETPLWLQVLIATISVTILELVFGLILNVWLGMELWNYSNLPYNFMGQICLYYTLLWIPSSLVAIIVDDLLRKILFKEEFKGYKLF